MHELTSTKKSLYHGEEEAEERLSQLSNLNYKMDIKLVLIKWKINSKKKIFNKNKLI